ncbi:hypothetical protein PIB30_066208 [Stylosanthes scabra]|uniref:Uncharacterized protein n=1 Tax=Stylosanthes scabra TaxID=79078 RepID=A0ABU6XMK3_9FABA|nr:hypothetical protein [Stylosanthes scabra]
MNHGHNFVAVMRRENEIYLTNLEKIYMVAKREAGPAPKSCPRFETERIPNPGDFSSSVLNRVLFLCKATILTSNTSVHEPTSRFGPALRLPRRSCAESAAFEASRVHPGLTPIHLGDLVQWVNQPVVHLVNRSTGLDPSTPVSHWSTPVNHRSTAVKAGQWRSTFFFLAPALHKKSNGYTRISRIRTTENSAGQSTTNYEENTK